MIVLYYDHMNRFFFDAYPSFALGVAETYPQADGGWGTRDFPDLSGHSQFSWHLAQSLVEDEFDPTICQEMTIDHGIFSILPLLAASPWPAPIVPIAANVELSVPDLGGGLVSKSRSVRQTRQTTPTHNKVGGPHGLA